MKGPLMLRPREQAYIARREALRIWLRLSRTEGKRTLTIFDPSLIAFRGHHWEFAQLIKRQFASSFDVRFYANFRAETKLVLSLPAQPICQEGVYPPSGDFDAGHDWMMAETIKSLGMIDSRDVGPDAILMMHTVTLYQLSALAQWISAIPKARRPTICVQLQFPLEFQLPSDSEVRKRAIGLARVAASTLAVTGRVRFASNSSLLADRLSRQLGQHCAVLPLPVRWPDLSRPTLPDPGVVFGFFGGLRPEKGASIIAQAIPAFAAQQPDTRFLVHAPISESDPSAIAILKGVPQVELIRESFDRKDDYFKHFLKASCILLPYDPIEYADRTSGILVEALGLGRMIITTKGSWLHAEAKRYEAMDFSITQYDASNLLSSLCAAREYLVSKPLEPKINMEVIKNHSAEAFRSSIVQLVRP